MPDIRPTIQAGDLMRFSVALMKDVAALPDQRSLLVIVKEVKTEIDGSKTLYVEHA